MARTSRMRQRRAQNPAVQHAGQRDIDGEAGRAGDLGAAVLPRHRLADHRELGIGRQRRRLVERDLPLHLAEADARDAEREISRVRVVPSAAIGQAFRALAAASVAATTCG